MEVRVLGVSTEVQQAISKITAAKTMCDTAGFEWYPYDSFGNLQFLSELLTARTESESLSFPSVLDVGCGDGDLAFLFEHLGSSVVAVDWPETNYNGMRGVRTLHDRLGSTVEIIEANIEDGLSFLGDRRFELVILAGVLYHLQNPFRILADSRARGRYCFLSTKILGRMALGSASLMDQPLAYLLDHRELNSDNTNYWLLTPSATHRLCRRCGWKTSASICTGESDERMYCLLERADLLTNGVVLHGLHEPEGFNEWRWAEKTFSVRFRNTTTGSGRICLKVAYHHELCGEWGAIAVGLVVNGKRIGEKHIHISGEHELCWDVADSDALITAEFIVSRATDRRDCDQRELSLIVIAITYVALSPTPVAW
jgi:tRNA (mo5U34)-methyltransferase